MLSKFGAGDTSNVDLSIDDSQGYDLEGRERVREYAESVTTSGWELAHVGDDKIWWQHPDPSRAKTYRIEKKSAGWHGKRAGRDTRPGYTEDLQDALDGVGEWLADHPLEKGDSGAEE